jgi:hypothetical protein
MFIVARQRTIAETTMLKSIGLLRMGFLSFVKFKQLMQTENHKFINTYKGVKMFQSTKVLPYVYMLTHKMTGQFYIGFRCANKLPSSRDLGEVYYTSSKFVKNNFSNFDFIILAEFFDKDFAYEFEQNLIKENFNNPLILNKHWQSTKKYSMLGFKRPDLSNYNKINKVKPKEERIYQCVTCHKIFTRLEFCHLSKKTEFVCGRKCNGIRSGKKSVGIKRPELSARMMGKIPWNKGIANPQAIENARKGAKKLSEKAKGRKRLYKEDGSWTWQYPEK